MQHNDQDVLQLEVAKGQRANKFLNEFVDPFTEHVRALLMDAFNKCSPTDLEALSDIRRMYMVIDEFESNINSYITTGRFASVSLRDDK